MLNSADQGKRLRQFLESKYPSMAEAARALGKSPQNLNAYLSGRQAAGPRMRKQLEALGLDMIWFDHGMGRADLDKRFSAMVQKVNQQAFTEEEKEIVAILRTLGVTNRLDFHLYFDYARAVQDKIERERKRKPSESLKAAEGIGSYRTDSRLKRAGVTKQKGVKK